jgi:beta-galactosidase
MTFPDRTSALSLSYERSPYYLLLNGTWRFFHVDSYRNLPDNIADPSLDVSSWAGITVPGNWEMQGYGYPIYINHGYGFMPCNPQAAAVAGS